MTKVREAAHGEVSPGARTLTVEEFAKRMNIGRNSAYEAIKRGEISVLRFGKLIRIPTAQVERMLEGR